MLLFLAPCQIGAFGDEELPPCCGETPTKDDHERRADRDRERRESRDARHADSTKGFPCGCPIARIEDLGDGVWLFQGERYATSCLDLPDTIDMYGPYNMPLSPGCDTNCVAAFLRKKPQPACSPPKYYPGLPDYAEHDSEEKLFPPYDGDYARLLTDPKIPYVKFTLASDRRRDRYAKVFVYDLDVKHACDKPASSRHVIYLAKEVAGPPDDENLPMPTVTPEPLQSDDVCRGKECHLFRVRCNAHRPAVQMLLLTVE